MEQLLLPVFVLMVLVTMAGGKPDSVASAFVGGVCKLLAALMTAIFGKE